MSQNPAVERRRSKRVSECVPLLVRGVDLLGHPFEERTSTLTLNLHGCRYCSKHHLPRNSWISIEVTNGGEPRIARARVAWIHRPHSIRDLFQIAVELEGAADIWGLASSPGDWHTLPPPVEYAVAATRQAAQGTLDVTEIQNQGQTIPMNSYSGDSLSSFERPPMANPMNHIATPSETSSASWREQLASDMAVAQRQWDELLQSSIDRSLQRLAEELPARAQDAVRSTEDRMAQQFANLSEMLAQMSSDAQNALAGVKSSIEQEVTRAREAIELARQQTIERIAAETETRVAPHAARVPELLRELSGREEQMAESLHLHRERLRHAWDNTLREISAQVETTAAAVRRDFEAARTEALAKWGGELEAMSARAAHSAGESLSRTCEWLQQETRERLQILSEQNLAAAMARLEEETSKAAGLFATHLEGQSIFHLAQVHQQMDGVADDLTGRARTQLAEAAESAAASFGQVLHNISTERTEEFNQTSRSSSDARREELENYTRQVHAAFESESASAIQGVRDQIGAYLQSSVSEARAAFVAESAAAIETHRERYAAHAQEWSERLDRVAEDAIAQGAGRIETAADTSTVAAVRRLNEHGQNAIESLMRSADQALRGSASKMFEGLAAALREQATNASSSAAAASFTGGNAPANP